MPRLVVAFCTAIAVGAVLAHYPDAFGDANETARANAALDYLDREVGGGNSLLPDQAIAVEARARIPERETFVVDFGAPQEGWSELATSDGITSFMRFFLLPRRESGDAPWVLCFACNPASHPGAEPVWKDEEGLSILHRGS